MDQEILGGHGPGQSALDGHRNPAQPDRVVVDRGRATHPLPAQRGPLQLHQARAGIPADQLLFAAGQRDERGGAVGLVARGIAQRPQCLDRRGKLRGREPDVQVTLQAAGRLGVDGVGKRRALHQHGLDPRIGEGAEHRLRLLALHCVEAGGRIVRALQAALNIGRQPGQDAGLAQPVERERGQPLRLQPLDIGQVQLVRCQPAQQGIRRGGSQRMEK